jgi:cobalt-zinc-cadmium efflux system protein
MNRREQGLGQGGGHRRGPGHDHAGGDDHGGGHGHEHDVRPVGRRRLAAVLALTAAFMVVEFAGGLLAGSLALLADAAHMLTDAGALALSLFALHVAQRPATAEKTYGYLRVEILAALLNGATLIVVAIFIFREAYQRFLDPPPVRSGLMLGVAVAGLLVNVVAARMLHGSAGHSLNVRGAYLHVLGDMLGSVGAVAAAIVIMLTGWVRADPLISVLVGMLILVSSWKLVRESADVLLEAVPSHIDLGEVREAMLVVSGVRDVHDLHIWTVTSGFLAMSGHAVVRDLAEHGNVLAELHRTLQEGFGIDHVTIQVEEEPRYSIEADGPSATGR